MKRAGRVLLFPPPAPKGGDKADAIFFFFYL